MSKRVHVSVRVYLRVCVCVCVCLKQTCMHACNIHTVRACIHTFMSTHTNAGLALLQSPVVETLTLSAVQRGLQKVVPATRRCNLASVKEERRKKAQEGKKMQDRRVQKRRRRTVAREQRRVG